MLPIIYFVSIDANATCSGAGGLGCEILKNLALSGFKDIHVIDMGMYRELKRTFILLTVGRHHRCFQSKPPISVPRS